MKQIIDKTNVARVKMLPNNRGAFKKALGGHSTQAKAAFIQGAASVAQTLWGKCAVSKTDIGDVCRSIDEYVGSWQEAIGGPQQDDIFGNALKKKVLNGWKWFFELVESTIPGRDRYKNPTPSNEEGEDFVLGNCTELEQVFNNGFDEEKYSDAAEAKAICFKTFDDILELREIEKAMEVALSRLSLVKIPEWYKDEKWQNTIDSFLTFCANADQNFDGEEETQIQAECTKLEEEIKKAGLTLEAEPTDEAKWIDKLADFNKEGGAEMCDKQSLNCQCSQADKKCPTGTAPPSHILGQFITCDAYKNNKTMKYMWTGLHCRRPQPVQYQSQGEEQEAKNRIEFMRLVEENDDAQYHDLCDTRTNKCRCLVQDDECRLNATRDDRQYAGYFLKKFNECPNKEKWWRNNRCKLNFPDADILRDYVPA
ncbi:hypothetical protein GQ602_001424 [Ophiocordyceps camponoti-floridani]|uniref:Uncharacterized protein n=1 Tax=Ophiocordyceps camponoti-floridani TaxID=2030778 RepID=A0A8H4QE31_9HYPO|nr:hypothetical protein GQ602_001424 [Ophiocordyceps camponoti-floridani]